MCDLGELREEIERREIKTGYNFIRGANSDILQKLKDLFPYISGVKRAKTGLYLTALHNGYTEPPSCPNCGKPIMLSKGNVFALYCSVKCAKTSTYSVDKRNKTNLERYGVENPMQSEEVKSKVRSTNLDRHGAENVMQLEEFRSKAKSTILQRYGVEHQSQSEEIKSKTKSTILQRYGVEHQSQSEEIKSKVRSTNLERYGVDYGFQSEEVKSKVRSTNLERYGAENVMQSEEVKSKVRSTNLERYGVENPMQLGEFVDKAKSTNLIRYGAENVMQLEEVKSKCMQTSMNRYGVNNPTQRHFSENLWQLESPDILKQLYLDNGKNCVVVASILGVNKTTVLNYMHKHGLSELLYLSSTSSGELEVSSFIKSIYEGEIVFNDRKVLSGRELDIYLPNENIAIEFNGVYWHCHLYKEKRYHQEKALACKEKGINLIQIWEDDWNNPTRQEVIKKSIKAKMGMLSETVYARKTVVGIVEPKQAKQFLETYHIQGKTTATIWLGLFSDEELVALAGIKELKVGSGEWDIVRFATSKSVVGGFSKLLKYFQKNYDWSKIISFANLDYSHGDLYERCGFSVEYITAPTLHFLVDDVRVRREHYMKSKLKYIFPDYDDSHVDTFLEERGIYRIYDSGKIKFSIVR